MSLWIHITPPNWSQNCVIYIFPTMCHNIFRKVAKVMQVNKLGPKRPTKKHKLGAVNLATWFSTAIFSKYLNEIIDFFTLSEMLRMLASHGCLLSNVLSFPHYLSIYFIVHSQGLNHQKWNFFEKPLIFFLQYAKLETKLFCSFQCKNNGLNLFYTFFVYYVEKSIWSYKNAIIFKG